MSRPYYLSGAPRPELVGEPGLGWMRTPVMGNRPIPGLWGADTGCYSPAGERHFDLGYYLKWLERQDRDSCLFATAPDKVGDPVTTWLRSMPVLPRIRELGIRAALVGQDGLEERDVDWDQLDCFFIGGTTDWKLGSAAARLARAAKLEGKWLHMGRVNSRRRYEYAAHLGCDSVDGTFLAFGPRVNLPRLRSWLVRGPWEVPMRD